MKILITGSNGQLGNELQKIVATGTAEIGSVSEEIKNSEVFCYGCRYIRYNKLRASKESFK